MLARLRMPVEECLEEYTEIGKNIFGSKRNLLGWLLKGSRYDSMPLVKEVNRLIDDRSHKKPPRMGEYTYANFPSPDDLCQT